VGLQLLGLSLQRHANLASLLDEVSGNQRYTLDYLTQEVLRQQPQDVQTFLLSRALAFTSHACFARRLRRLEGGVLSGDTPYPSKGLRPLHSCLSGFSGKRKGSVCSPPASLSDSRPRCVMPSCSRRAASECLSGLRAHLLRLWVVSLIAQKLFLLLYHAQSRGRPPR